MPTTDHPPAPEDTHLLPIVGGGTQVALPVAKVTGLLTPRNRRSDGRAGAFEVTAIPEPPPDFVDYAARHAVA